MASIRILSDLVVNKIAAGEVVERPASVVKELLENALDAGATQIDVTIEEAGNRLIRVADNGRGMDEADLRLCVAPHATSKIADESDLEHIATLGFRGEALASIGSVSQLRIVSRPADGSGHEITVEANRAGVPRPVAAGPGTVVEVRNLFFNVPARRKFMRHQATETAHVTETLARAALAFPQVGFTLRHNGRTTHRLDRGRPLVERLSVFYGRELGESLIPLPDAEGEPRVRGFIAPPARSRASGKWQMIFVNGRFVRDRVVQHAVREAYLGLTEANRQPVAFLFLELPPDWVDVNVHPTKVEVRWRDSGLIHSRVLATLRGALGDNDLTPALTTERASVDPQRSQAIVTAMADFFRRAEPQQRQLGFAPTRFHERPAVRSAPADDRDPDHPPVPEERATAQPHQEAPTPARQAPGERPPGDRPAPWAKALQIHNTYLVVESADGLLIVDQHALHERILAEQLSARLGEGNLEAQRLLLPETVQLSEGQRSLLELHESLLTSLGLETSHFGPNTVAVHSCPVLLAGVSAGALLVDLLDRLGEAEGSPGKQDLLADALNLMACKAAVKAGDPLSEPEIASLLAQREQVERASNCPHGRPTTLRLSVRDLERQFKRA